ncbi:MAG: hypothetical protein QM811_28225 [Pirellulales bacterium]
MERIRALLNGTGPKLLVQGETIVAARVDDPEILAIPQELWRIRLESVPDIVVAEAAEWDLFEYPHDVVRLHQKYVAENLAARIGDAYTQLQDGVFVGPDVTLGAHLTCDASKGPIIIERGAILGPFCFLRGPLYIGAARGSTNMLR